ncbi:hypothetical protein Ahy_B06g081750 isoform B [Arachis hypogaea]|uniref:C2 domain-containing protein n=1 Tax=Arachis hypogaea TaxID=3818 RepID=A0A444YLU0_ARAHY|nr:hypothetical protein Ahy_B06g081750 isoform B [Arachis hypogaea]
MGNCFSDVSGGRAAIGGTARGLLNAIDAPNDAVDNFLRSRGYPASSLRSSCRFLLPACVIEMFSLRFRVYDIDTQFHNLDVKMLKLEEKQFLGEATCALSEVMWKSFRLLWLFNTLFISENKLSSQELFPSTVTVWHLQIIIKSDRSLALELHREDPIRSMHSQNCRKLLVHAEECVGSKTTVEMIFRCSDLENRDLFSKSDPFLIISKVVEGGTHIPICKTEVIKNDLSPQWKPVFLNIQQVGGKAEMLLCFIRKVQKSLAELEKLHASGQGGTLFLPTGGGHNSHNKVLKSRVYLDKFSESVQYSFLDYMSAGFELNFMVAIDFTASNGNPRLPDSSGRPNAYQKAIVEVGEVLQFSDSDKRFPSWGFGARPIDGPVEGIQGIMMAYTSALLNVSVAGPTLFGPVISNAALTASQSVATGARKYFVLLIITEGVVTDLQETIDALVKASDLPLSILIVGVGGADFKEMEFVPFRDVQSRWRNFSSSSTSSRITYSIFIVHEKQEYPTDSLRHVGGWTQEYDGLTFVAIRGAGHEVPLHRPKLALSLFKSFMAGTSMPTLQLVSDS